MKKNNKRKVKLLIEILAILFGLGLVTTSVLIIWISSLKMPDFNTIAALQMESTTKIYDRTGKVLLYAFRQKIRRTEVPLSEMSPNIINATIAIEDDKFYSHSGISIRGIARAFLVTLTSDKIQGGSTITQQVVKNSLLTQDRSIERKVKEIILALKLESAMSKDDILALYLNNNPYSGEIYGIEEASQYYFGKSAKDLSLAEAAYLAAIPQNPSKLSPYGKNFDMLEARKNTVLHRMYETGKITKEQYDTEKEIKVAFIKKEDNQSKAHHFVFYLRDYLEKKYGEDFLTQGLSVKTTLDYDLQKQVEEISKDYITNYIQKNNTKKNDLAKLNTAVVVLDPNTGQILSMLGSRDYNDLEIDGKFNVATALRQPGSAMKPIVYAAAFEKGFGPENVIYDTPTEFNPSCGQADGSRREAPCYSPQNFDSKFLGAISLREALGNSRNIPAVKLLYLVGVGNAVDFAKRLGITSLTDPDRYGLSLVLGGGEVSLLEMTNAYSVFPENGVYHKHVAILEVKDKSGKVLEQYSDKGYDVVDQNVTSEINSVLSDNSARVRTFGASSGLYFPGVDVAAKTGTTNNFRDGWAIGYTTGAVVGAWIGKNDNTSIGETAASISIVPMWNKIMKVAINKYGTSGLAKEYQTDTSLNGVQCSTDGTALDLIYTVLARGMLPNINSGDAQLSQWYRGTGSCGGTTDPAATSTPQTGVTVDTSTTTVQN